MFFVPVVNQLNQPLMPTTLLRARRWIQSRKATPFWKKGIFCVRLNIKPSNNKKQEICVGIDPGSKREAYAIKSEAHTYINILSETVDWVKDAVEQRRQMRRTRRYRKTPCRKNRSNRKNLIKDRIPPSTKARWQFKLNICKLLLKMFPIDVFVVEDIKATTRKGSKKWNTSFSPLEVGKRWFYSQVEQLGELILKQGYETKELRDQLGLKKSSSKLDDKFECHNVDSWVLANYVSGGHVEPDNKSILKMVPLRFHRRQLHALQPTKHGIRRDYGRTRSLGFKRGSLVKHNKFGLCHIGGTSKVRISIHSLSSGRRLSQHAKQEDCKFRCYSSVRFSSTGAKAP